MRISLFFNRVPPLSSLICRAIRIEGTSLYSFYLYPIITLEEHTSIGELWKKE